MGEDRGRQTSLVVLGLVAFCLLAGEFDRSRWLQGGSGQRGEEEKREEKSIRVRRECAMVVGLPVAERRKGDGEGERLWCGDSDCRKIGSVGGLWWRGEASGGKEATLGLMVMEKG
ncbi:hypothetical protein HAX54_000800 [Datura stramonium]|uniref:Uncharacterized protein n=1 Tax=Datura stramonium TaxID=4076 RepID=A0ABS8T2J7_DATST|nr:hypothetical protein [Datura stramonium]